MALSKLIKDIESTISALESTKTYNASSLKLFSSTEQSPYEVFINKVQSQKTWFDKMTQYSKIIHQCQSSKHQLERLAKEMIENKNFSEDQKESISRAAEECHQWFIALAKSQLHLANELLKSKSEIGRGEIEKELLKLQTNILSYKKTLESVSVAIADHQLRDIGEGEIIRLDKLIPYLHKVYDNVYQEKNPILRKIKNALKNSDRIKEIEFLNELSKDPECTESIRFQAICLVRNKIKTEFFGKGSTLRKLLESIDEKSIEKNGEEKLSQFISTHSNLMNKMPQSLIEFLAKDDEWQQTMSSGVRSDTLL